MLNLKFWTVVNNTVTVNISDILNFLAANDFGTYYRDENSTNTDPTIIRVNRGVVCVYNVNSIRKYCIDSIHTSDESDFMKSQINREFVNKTRFLKPSDFHILPRLKLDFIRDTENEAFFFFRNCPVKVSRQVGVQPLEYGKLQGVIWDSQIINHDFFLIPSNTQVMNSEFGQFLRDVSTENDKKVAHERFSQICAIIGFLLHDYKNPAFSKAVVFYDYNNNQKRQGGTGKTLLSKSLSELKKVKIIDGKLFNPTKNFAFSGIDETTRIIVFDDIRPNFEFNNLLSVITSGLTVENKFQNSFYIPPEKSAKIVITSNYVINGNSNSIRRRLMEFDFSDFYIKNPAPDKKFGHLFFSGWNEGEWNRFFNFMLTCVLKYFQGDVLNNISALNEQRRLIYSTCEEFITFVYQDLESTYDPHTGKYNKNRAYSTFSRKFWKKEVPLEPRVFTKWLQTYAASIGAVYEQTHSNNNYFFRLSTD